MAVVSSEAWPSTAATVGSGTPAVTAATPWLWRRPRGQALGAGDAGAAHELAHLTVRGLAGDRPQEPVPAPGARLGASHTVHEVEGLDQVLRHRNGPPGGAAALECRDSQLGGLEVDIAGAQRQRFAHAAAGKRERTYERLHGRLRVSGDGVEESRTLRSGEVLPPPRVDQRHVDGGGHCLGRRVIARGARRLSAPCPATLVPTAGGGRSS